MQDRGLRAVPDGIQDGAHKGLPETKGSRTWIPWRATPQPSRLQTTSSHSWPVWCAYHRDNIKARRTYQPDNQSPDSDGFCTGSSKLFTAQLYNQAITVLTDTLTLVLGEPAQPSWIDPPTLRHGVARRPHCHRCDLCCFLSDPPANSNVWSPTQLIITMPIPKVYADLLIFNIMVHVINDKRILPNMTVGYFICDNCGDAIHTVYNILHILSGYNKEAPNYSCSNQGEVIGFVGSNIAMAELIRLFGYPQISYLSTDPISNIHKTRSYFNIAHSQDSLELDVVVAFMKEFGWNWIGIMMSYDDNTEIMLHGVKKWFAITGICIAYVVKLTGDSKANRQELTVIQKSTARVMLVLGYFSSRYTWLGDFRVILQNITLIIHESWIHNFLFCRAFLAMVNDSFIITSTNEKDDALIQYLNNVTRKAFPEDPILEKIYYFYFGCTNIDPKSKAVFQLFSPVPEKVCPDDAYKLGLALTNIYFPSYYYVQLAVEILTSTMHLMQSPRSSNASRDRYKLQGYIRRLHFIASKKGNLYYKANGSSHSVYLKKWIFGKSECDEKLIAKFTRQWSGNTYVEVYTKNVTWKNGRAPESRCSPRCLPGHRKAPKHHIHACCYDCVPCSGGEMSNKTDSENCQRCPDDKWPDEKKVKCIPKIFEYLSYEEDILTPSIAVISLLGSVITGIIVRVFILFWNTPVVKANNRTVSIILLTSILLSFLCVFFFLGRPLDITCMLRQVSFGIFFTIALSCVLAKTITVCIAFKITKPGSYWNKWLGVKLANYVVLICSSVQVMSSLIWLSVSRPYQEYDMSSYHEKIIIQCNEGSVIGFYSVLGYLGFLAAVSFVLAFMVRTLPDSFNEAKYITFSMLVFCSVWIAMIPAYLSTRGKYMVAVEIFAILTSCAGLLGCIFFPKLYIIVIKPEMNNRQLIKQNIN
ncbi:vomeronasal type-2 receptor 26-like [Gastrophryne carolinensis]